MHDNKPVIAIQFVSSTKIMKRVILNKYSSSLQKKHQKNNKQFQPKEEKLEQGNYQHQPTKLQRNILNLNAQVYLKLIHGGLPMLMVVNQNNMLKEVNCKNILFYIY